MLHWLASSLGAFFAVFECDLYKSNRKVTSVVEKIVLLEHYNTDMEGIERFLSDVHFQDD